LVQLTLLCKDIAEIDACADEVRLESYGPGVMNSGIFRPSDPAQRQSKVVVKSWHPIVQGDRLSDQIYCSVVATDLVGDNSKQMEAIDVICINREYFSVADLRLSKLA